MLSNRSPFETPRSASTQNYADTKWTFKRQILKLIGAAFFVSDQSGNLVLYADQKAFKWKEDIRIYSGQDKQTEVLRIAARSVLDFNSAYDIFDSASGQKLGALRRSGMKSMVRDEWRILDPNDREIGAIIEDSLFLALARRVIDLISIVSPQKYTITLGDRIVGQFAQTFNPFTSKIEADFSADSAGLLDRRLALAAGILMCAIEGKQE